MYILNDPENSGGQLRSDRPLLIPILTYRYGYKELSIFSTARADGMDSTRYRFVRSQIRSVGINETRGGYSRAGSDRPAGRRR